MAIGRRLRREIVGLAHGIDRTSASFVLEWRATLKELQRRRDRLATLEDLIAPILRPPGVEPFMIEQFKRWIIKMRPVAEQPPWLAVEASPRPLHPVVH